MIGTTKLAAVVVFGGALTLAGSWLTTHTLLRFQGESLDLVERYGLLGLHAAVVLGLGGAMCKIGWEIAKTNRRIASTLDTLTERLKEDRDDNDRERDRAVDSVRESIGAAREDIMRELGNVRTEIARNGNGKGK